jgi:hypothetical protein
VAIDSRPDLWTHAGQVAIGPSTIARKP